MKDFDSRFIIEGTSALKLDSCPLHATQTPIIPFPVKPRRNNHGDHARVEKSFDSRVSSNGFFIESILSRSTLLGDINKCSLRGQAFGQLSKWETAVFFSIFTAIAFAGVIFGA